MSVLYACSECVCCAVCGRHPLVVCVCLTNPPLPTSPPLLPVPLRRLPPPSPPPLLPKVRTDRILRYSPCRTWRPPFYFILRRCALPITAPAAISPCSFQSSTQPSSPHVCRNRSHCHRSFFFFSTLATSSHCRHHRSCFRRHSCHLRRRAPSPPQAAPPHVHRVLPLHDRPRSPPVCLVPRLVKLTPPHPAPPPPAAAASASSSSQGTF